MNEITLTTQEAKTLKSMIAKLGMLSDEGSTDDLETKSMWNKLDKKIKENERSVKERSIELEAKKSFDELIESCGNLTTKQKRVAFKRIIKDEVEPGEVGVAVRHMLSDYLKTL